MFTLLLATVLLAEPDDAKIKQAEKVAKWIKKDYLEYIRNGVKPMDAMGRLADEYHRTYKEIEHILGKDKPAFKDYRPKNRPKPEDDEKDEPDDDDDKELNLFPVEDYGETKVQFFWNHDRFKKTTEYVVSDRFDDFELMTILSYDKDGKSKVRLRFKDGIDPSMLVDDEPERYDSKGTFDKLAKAKMVEIRCHNKEYTLTPDSVNGFKLIDILEKSISKRKRLDFMCEHFEDIENGIPLSIVYRKFK